MCRGELCSPVGDHWSPIHTNFYRGETNLYFQTRILFVSFIATVIISIFVIPVLRRLKVGQIERDDGPQSHFKKQGTPTMGGIIIALRNYYRHNWRIFILCV